MNVLTPEIDAQARQLHCIQTNNEKARILRDLRMGNITKESVTLSELPIKQLRNSQSIEKSSRLLLHGNFCCKVRSMLDREPNI
jgi:hypothetical protein